MKRKNSKNNPVEQQPSEESSMSGIETALVGVQYEFQGPLPPPGILAQYENIKPGFAERILSLTEGEAIHRRQLQARKLEGDLERQARSFGEARWGQVCALLIGLAAILGGVYSSVHGAELPGSLIGTGGVVALTYVFIRGRKPQPKKKNPSEEDR